MTNDLCPLCGSANMANARPLYGTPVARRCYYGFANRRQLAYALDVVCLWILAALVGYVVGALILKSGRQLTEEESTSVGQIISVALTVAFTFKDGFAGYSLGKAICGVQVIDEDSGAPIGFGASFKRTLPLLVPFLPIIVAFALCKGHRPGDGWSHTKVIWKKYADLPIFLPTSALELERGEITQATISAATPSSVEIVTTDAPPGERAAPLPEQGLYVYAHDEQLGPLSLDEVKALLAANKIARTDLIWHDGLADWLPLGNVL